MGAGFTNQVEERMTVTSKAWVLFGILVFLNLVLFGVRELFR